MKKVDKDIVASVYLKGNSIRATAEILNISAKTAGSIVSALKIGRNKSASQLIQCRRNTDIPIDFSFRDLTPQKAWLLGLIFGDGSISKQGYSFVLTSGDKDIINNAKAIVGHKGKIFEHGTYQVISFNSKRLVQELVACYGLHSNKSHTMKMPFLGSETLVSHFHRGLLDSDGCFTFDTRTSKVKLVYSYVTMSKSFAQSILEDLQSFCFGSLDRHLNKTANGAYQVRFTGDCALLIRDWLYEDSHETNRCQRKFNVSHKVYV